MTTRKFLLSVGICLLLSSPASALFVHEGTELWPVATPIHVCWHPAFDILANSNLPGTHDIRDIQARVTEMVNQSWGRYSSLSFIGWDTCTVADASDTGTIMIELTDGFFDRSHSIEGRPAKTAGIVFLTF